MHYMNKTFPSLNETNKDRGREQNFRLFVCSGQWARSSDGRVLKQF